MSSEPGRREWPRPVRLAGATVVSLLLITLPGLGVWYAVDYLTPADPAVNGQSVAADTPPSSGPAPDSSVASGEESPADSGVDSSADPSGAASDATGETPTSPADPGSDPGSNTATDPADPGTATDPGATADGSTSSTPDSSTGPTRVVEGQDLVPKPRKTNDGSDPIDIVIPKDIPEIQQSVSFTVSSYNVLGYGHTTPGKGRAHYGNGNVRMGYATDAIRSHNVSVAGLQELQTPQLRTFLQRTGGEYSVYPGNSAPRLHNHVIWRNSEWTALETHMVKIPYFRGNQVPMPYVRLQHKLTGHTVWVASFHNPANAHGNAQHWRDRATSIEAALANRLQSGGEPVIFTGDFNDRERFVCPITRSTGMRSSNGAHSEGGSCRMPRRTNVDWILGSNSIAFSGHVADKSGNLAKASDHFMIRATATLEGGVPPRPTNCDPAATEDPACQGG